MNVLRLCTTQNLLIYGPGGYKVKDFVYIGTPMQIILWILTTIFISNETAAWYFSWIWTFVAFVLVCLVFVFPYYVTAVFHKARDKARDALQRRLQM